MTGEKICRYAKNVQMTGENEEEIMRTINGPL